MSTCHITAALQSVDAASHSILPTGRLKIEDGRLYQEAMIIVHKASRDRAVGIGTEWIPFPDDIMERIQVV